MLIIAIRMLLADRAKCVLLVSGVAFSSFLISQQAGVFLGIIGWMTSHLNNVAASIWVVDPKTEQINELFGIRDIEVSRVRSVNEVSWAVPFSILSISASVPDGTFKPVFMLGLDDETLLGIPSKVRAGELSRLFEPEAVLVDQRALEVIQPFRKPLEIGDSFEINDVSVRVVGVADTERNFSGYACVFMRQSLFQRIAPNQRKRLSGVLVQARDGISPQAAARAIERKTGLKAFTIDEFRGSTVRWFFRNTGIPASFATTILLGAIVGLAICGQTFFAFVHENLKSFAALKCMGASNRILARMLAVQAFLAGSTGLSFGFGLTALFGFAVSGSGQPPFELPGSLLALTAVSIACVIGLAAIFSVRTLRSVDPVSVFRS